MIDVRVSPPHLSVVAVSRNDDHGGAMLQRMQYFVDAFFAQCRRHDLAAELILVEWNPPSDRPPLCSALRWPSDFGPATARIITVPHEVHARFDHSDGLPLFQMIGKNVGIRRAKGRFVLATNIDILLGDDLVRYLRDHLVPGTFVRVDRYDIPGDLPVAGSAESVLSFAEANYFQVSTRLGVFDVERLRVLGLPIGGRTFGLTEAARVLGIRQLLRRLGRRGGASSRKTGGSTSPRQSVRETLQGVARRVRQRIVGYARVAIAGPSSAWRFWRSLWIHTNACGDFTLMARDDWFRLRGYAEWPMYSFHIDSILLVGAAANRVREVVLGPRYRAFHIDHSAGSGWSPDGARKLFARLDAAGVPYLSDDDLWQWRVDLAVQPARAVINGPDWGLADEVLLERPVVVPGRLAATGGGLS